MCGSETTRWTLWWYSKMITGGQMPENLIRDPMRILGQVRFKRLTQDHRYACLPEGRFLRCVRQRIFVPNGLGYCGGLTGLAHFSTFGGFVLR